MPYSPDQIATVKRDHPIEPLIAARVKLGRPSARGIRAGACLCAPVRGKSPLFVDIHKQTFGCLRGGCRGDIFDFYSQFEGVDFASALRRLAGVPTDIDPEQLARARADRERRRLEREALERAAVERERAKAYQIWRAAAPAAGTLIDAYFHHRGLDPLPSRSLRYSADEPCYTPGPDPDAPPTLIYSGPAMVAAIVGADGGFLGVHRTWIDPRLAAGSLPADASGKAEIRRADGVLLPAKKMRGAKRGGAIRLNAPPRLAPRSSC